MNQEQSVAEATPAQQSYEQELNKLAASHLGTSVHDLEQDKDRTTIFIATATREGEKNQSKCTGAIIGSVNMIASSLLGVAEHNPRFRQAILLAASNLVGPMELLGALMSGHDALEEEGDEESPEA